MRNLGQNIVWLLNRFLTTLVEEICLIQKKALSLQSESMKMNFVYFAFYYLLAINIITFIVYGIDKLKAKHSWWRIPESTLLILAAVGGSLEHILNYSLHKAYGQVFFYFL